MAPNLCFFHKVVERAVRRETLIGSAITSCILYTVGHVCSPKETVLSKLAEIMSPATSQLRLFRLCLFFSTFLLLLCYPCFSVFTCCLHRPPYFLVSLSSLCPFQPGFSLLLFSLCWILQSFHSPIAVLSHLFLSHVCHGIDLDPCLHEGDVTHTSNTPQSLQIPKLPPT